MFLVCVIFLIAVVPIGIIHGLNVLFHSGIPFTFESWYMTLFFCLVIRFLLTPIVTNQTSVILPTQEKGKENELPPPEA